MKMHPLQSPHPVIDERPLLRPRVVRLRPDTLAVTEMPAPSWAADQYRGIAIQVSERLEGRAEPCTLMVTSPEQGSGKTLTALNLGLSLAETVDRRVALVEADLHRPQLYTYFEGGDRHALGLRQMLTEQADPAAVALRVQDTALDVVLAGHGEAASEAMSPPRLARCLGELRARYGLLVVDSPPVPALPSARALLSRADLVVVVVRAGRTAERGIESVLEIVGRERLLGFVLNASKPGKGTYGYYYR